MRHGKRPRELPRSASAEEPRAMDEMKARVKPVVMLRPSAAVAPLPSGTSKIGGLPDLPPDFAWPRCSEDGAPLYFILQLFRKDFPEFPFPAGHGQWVLFRCPNHQFTLEPAPHPLWLYLANDDIRPTAPPPDPPLHDMSLDFSPLRECCFEPERTTDYPGSVDEQLSWWGEPFAHFRRRHTRYGDGRDWEKYLDPRRGENWSSPVFDQFCEEVASREGTKIGGFAAYQQGSAQNPMCRCGRSRIEFVFQVSSADPPPPNVRKHPLAHASDHGLMIGDEGNVYFYMCPLCGPDSLTTDWDCG
jgi:hypothetical protein